MSILVDKNTRLIVQGITGNEGLFHTTQMVAYGTNVVGGVTPGKGGEWVLEKLPVFDSVKTAKDATDANATIIFVPRASRRTPCLKPPMQAFPSSFALPKAWLFRI